jgi:ABC-type Fe3+/spermidine/putrescine transport system ATPase subunit
VQQGDPRSLHDAPQNSFVADFMGASNIVTLDARHEGEALVLGGRAWCPELRLANADIPPPAGPSSALHGQVDVHFRSTAARLAARGASAEGLSLCGTVLQSTYPGNAFRYAVKVEDKVFLVDDPESFAEGDQVVINLPVSAIHLFPPAEDRAAA